MSHSHWVRNLQFLGSDFLESGRVSVSFLWGMNVSSKLLVSVACQLPLFCTQQTLQVFVGQQLLHHSILCVSSLQHLCRFTARKFPFKESARRSFSIFVIFSDSGQSPNDLSCYVRETGKWHEGLFSRMTPEVLMYKNEGVFETRCSVRLTSSLFSSRDSLDSFGSNLSEEKITWGKCSKSLLEMQSIDFRDYHCIVL